MPYSPAGALLVVALACTSAHAGDWSPICQAPREQFSQAIVSDGAGGAYVGWIDARSGYNEDVYLQRFVPGGVPGPAPGWPVNGQTVTLITCWKRDLALAPDGSGGAIAAWSDDRCNSQPRIYAQRIQSSRSPAPGWPANGVALGPVYGRAVAPAITTDGAGGAFVAWVDTSGVAMLYASHVLSSGALDAQWAAGGLLLSTSVKRSTRPILVADGSGGAEVVWESLTTGQSDVLAQHLTSSGGFASGWPSGGLGICRAAGDQLGPCAVADGSGGVLAAWIDRRSLPARLFAGRLSSGGTLPAGWAVDGNAVCNTATAAANLVLAQDGSGGAFMAWQDTRGQAPDVFAQHLTSAGAATWGTTGIAVCAADSAQVSPSIARDGSGGVFVAWSDRRAAPVSGADIDVQRLTSAGAPVAGWPTNGMRVTEAPNDQALPVEVADAAGGVFVAWSDHRDDVSHGTDLWLGRVAATGPLTTQVQSMSAFHRDGQTFLTWPSPPGTGWTFRVYRRTAPIATRADLDAASLLCTLGDSSACDRRLSVLLGQPLGFAADSLAGPLDPARGLFVYTPAAGGAAWYAVTSQRGSIAEDRSVTPGDNSTAASLPEVVARPRLVYQRDLVQVGRQTSVFTLWTSPRDTPVFHAMANREAMAFDCGITRAGPPVPGSLLIRPQPRGMSFLDCLISSGVPGEWVLALDDGLPNGENTFWFGYHPAYDVASWTDPVPGAGTVVDYTFRRVTFTLDWTLATFPIDSTQVYAFGYSMGGIGGVELAFWTPRRIAAVMSVVGKFDFSFQSDPDTSNWFNTGHWGRDLAESMWGTVAANLPASTGRRTYDQLNLTLLAQQWSTAPLPPIFAINGKRDNVTGWAEKIPFYQAMQASRLGGCFLWGPEDHYGTRTWMPMVDPCYLHRFRTNLSYPALSHCSTDANPGDGTFASGDSVGTINGFLEWDTAIQDGLNSWRVILRLRDLATYGDTIPAPDSCTVDVTPARLQHFTFGSGPLLYNVTRASDSAPVQSGSVAHGPSGSVTIPAVKVYRSGSVLTVSNSTPLDVPGSPGRPGHLSLALLGNPVRGRAEALVEWPAAAGGVLDVLDVAGRSVLHVTQASGATGPARVSLSVATIPPGLYFVRASAGGRHVMRRLVRLE